jgi:hypothetical protein
MPLRMEIDVELLVIIRFLIAIGGIFPQSPEIIRIIAIGELMVQDVFFAWKIYGSVDCSNQLVLDRI